MKKSVLIPIVVTSALVFFIAFSVRRYEKIEVNARGTEYTPITTSPILKVFFENSGSMNGYMCGGSQLKDAVYDYVGDLSRLADTLELNYINSKIIPYKNNLSSYIMDLTPDSFHRAGGNTSNTDFGSIVASVLNEVDSNSVAVLISDCILDLPTSDSSHFLRNCQIRIKDEILCARDRIPNLAIEILQFFSDFEGRYFYPDGKIERLERVQRPYYIWVFGCRDYLAMFNAAVPFIQLQRFGLANIVSFSNKSDVPFEITNETLTGNIALPRSGSYRLILMADFKTTLLPPDIISDKDYYSFNNSALSICNIQSINNQASKYTHLIWFDIPENIQITNSNLRLNTPHLPSWVDLSNDDSGDNVNDNLEKTTGIKNLINGVADAYRSERIVTEFNFDITKI